LLLEEEFSYSLRWLVDTVSSSLLEPVGLLDMLD
jgi:hypothetical protein